MATISWDANTEPDMASYNVYRGTTSGVYTSFETVAHPTTLLYLHGLLVDTRYFFVVTAVDTSLNESAASAEVWTFFPTLSPAIYV